MEHVIDDVAAAAAWLVEQGCKAAPLQAPSHSGVIFTQPGSDMALFAQCGDTLVRHGAVVSVETPWPTN